MKTYLTALLSLLISPVLAFAVLDVTLSESSVVSVGGYSLVVSGSASIDSILVDTSSFSVQLSPGSSFTVTSADRKAFTTSPTTYTTSQTCSATQSLVTVGMTSGPVTTVTITPSSSNCTLSEGGIIGGGGGGGGGAPTPVYTVIPGTASSASSVSSAASSATAIAQAPSTAKTITTPSGVIPTSPELRRAGITITKSLKLGSQDSEVKALQQALAQDKTIYPEGLATGYYGPATQRAIIRFQKKYGIDPVGFVGPQTRKKINEVYGQAAVSEIPSGTPAAGVGATIPTVTTPSGVIPTSPELRRAGITITKSLKLGSQDSEVKALQQALAQDKTIYPEGLVTGYYGQATQRAIIRFQKKYGIDPVGFVGPQTRKKINEIYGQTPAPAPSSAQSSS